MLDLVSNPAVWASFLTLTILEIVLGVDNVVFISIAANKLPPEQRRSARLVGLAGALVLRIGLFGVDRLGRIAERAGYHLVQSPV